jgi:hypothetical protein
MDKFAPTRIFLLVLMLAVSHVALISHVTVHFSPDLEQCELCVSYAQQLAAIPSGAQDAQLEPAPVNQPLVTLRNGAAVTPPNAHRQRAPPALSA